jgi:hypothetical protein
VSFHRSLNAVHDSFHTERSQEWLRHWGLGTGSWPLPLPPVTFITRYRVPIAPGLPKTEPTCIPAVSGSPPRGYVALCL